MNRIFRMGFLDRFGFPFQLLGNKECFALLYDMSDAIDFVDAMTALYEHQQMVGSAADRFITAPIGIIMQPNDIFHVHKCSSKFREINHRHPHYKPKYHTRKRKIIYGITDIKLLSLIHEC
ncbi:hypothetical protein D3C73_1019240 [compost metagenome]